MPPGNQFFSAAFGKNIRWTELIDSPEKRTQSCMKIVRGFHV
jgi:hypothetical protein